MRAAQARAGRRSAAAPTGRRRPHAAQSTVSTSKRARATPPSPRRPRQGRPRVRPTATIHQAGADRDARRPPGHRGGRPRRTTPATRPTHRGRADRRRDQHVGGHRDHRDPAGQRRDDRGARELGGERDGHGLGRPTRQPPLQGVAPRRPEHQDRAGGQRREHEAGRARQPRVDQDQDEHRDAQRAQPASPPTGGQARQRDQAHRGRPQHARVGPGQHHEADRAEHAHRPRGPARAPRGPGSSQQRGEHQGEVGAGDREQVGQPAGAEVVGHLVRQAASSPVTSAGTRVAGVARPRHRVAADRHGRRRPRSTTTPARARCATSRGHPDAARRGRRSSAGCNRPTSRSRLPSSTSASSPAGAISSTGERTGVPHPATGHLAHRRRDHVGVGEAARARCARRR